MVNSFHISQNTKSNSPLEKDQASLSQIVEALLFSSSQSLTVRQIVKITGIKEAKKILQIIAELNAFYRDHGRAFCIQKVAGGYQLRTDYRFQKWIKKGKVIKPLQLSQPVMETLSIIAYQQPVTRAEIEEIRTVDATYTLRTLLDKKLIKITGRKEIVGRPILYGTTRFFLEVFGFFSIEDLPRPENFDILVSQEGGVDFSDDGI